MLQVKGRTICYYFCCLSLYQIVSRQNVSNLTNVFIIRTFSCACEPEQYIEEESESFAEVGQEAEEEEVEEGEGVTTDPDWAEDIKGSEVTE